MDYKDDLYNIVKDFLARKYDLSDPTIEFIETKKDFEGDITIVLFNIIKLINDEDKESLGESIGNELVAKSNIVDEFNLVQGFLNLEIANFTKFCFQGPNNQETLNIKYLFEIISTSFSPKNFDLPLHWVIEDNDINIIFKSPIRVINNTIIIINIWGRSTKIIKIIVIQNYFSAPF